MIIADSSVWIDHFRCGDKTLKALLAAGSVLTHPCVIGELALGHLRKRTEILRSLHDLSQATFASDEEVLAFIESNALAGQGIGYVDAQLLASARLSSALLFTRDKQLHEVAVKLGLAYTRHREE